MRNAQRGRQRQLGAGKFFDNPLQRRARPVHVLHQFQMPVGKLVHRGGKLLGRHLRRAAKLVQRDFRARANPAGPRASTAAGRAHALEIVRREFRELLADFHDGFERLALFPPGLRDGVIWLRLRRFRAAVVKRRERFGDQLNDAVPPDQFSAPPHEQHQNQTLDGTAAAFREDRERPP